MESIQLELLALYSTLGCIAECCTPETSFASKAFRSPFFLYEWLLFLSPWCSYCLTALTFLGSTHRNFSTFLLQEEDLYEIVIPLKFIASVGTRVHGLACWFDVLFNGRRVLVPDLLTFVLACILHLQYAFLVTCFSSHKFIGFIWESPWSAVLYKGGLQLPLVRLPPTGTNYVVFCLSHSMWWQGKKLLASSGWLPTMLRVTLYI
jgi:hypothetical protein